MRVLHICPYMHSSEGGPPVAVERLCRYLPKYGWDAAVLRGSPFSDDDLAELPHYRESQIPVEVLPIRRSKLLAFSKPARSAISGQIQNSDIVHVHGLWHPMGALVRAACTKYSRPYIISPHGMLDPWALKNSVWKKRIAAFLYETKHLENAACIHALNVAESKAIRSYGLRSPISILPNGVELPTDREPAIPRWGHDLPDEAGVLPVRHVSTQ